MPPSFLPLLVAFPVDAIVGLPPAFLASALTTRFFKSLDPPATIADFNVGIGVFSF